MNKRDRQNKTTLKRERASARILVAGQPLSSPFVNVTQGESSMLCRNQGPHELVHPTG